MDSRSVASEHEVDSGVGSMNSLESSIYVSVTIPDLNVKKSMQFIAEESVWSAKQQIISSVAKGLKEVFNYGLFIPSTNGRAGKFMDEGRLLKEYPLSAPLGTLQFIRKRRIYKHMMTSEKKMKQLHNKTSLKLFMEWVRKADVEKVVRLTNQGLDPNFIDHDSGETPLTLSISLEHPIKMVVSLVGGGAHLDYHNAKGLTPMHVASMLGREEGIKGLLDLGASANYYDPQGLTPLYHCICSNASTRCLEMLLYNHAIVGASDDSLWTELHQACKWGRVQLLELLIYYGANLNAQNSGGNTPLHVCAVNSQEECARIVLFRGADKTIKNFANHDAFETAIISGNASLAQVIRDFSSDDVVPYQDMPRLNEKRRTSVPSSSTGSGTSTLQRWRSNPQINLLGGDDKMSVRSLTFRHEYDLTLPSSNSGASRSANQRVNNRPLATGLKPNRIAVHPNNNNTASERQMDKTSANSNRYPLPRTIFLTPGKGGYGFILRGSRGSADDSDFTPTMEIPGLQYFSIIAQNSAAELAGIKPKDFLLEVNGRNVQTASHDYTVNLIKQAKDILCLVVVSPVESQLVKHDGSGMSSQSHMRPPLASRSISLQQHRRSSGLEELEALERSIASSSSSSSSVGPSSRYDDSASTPQRLLIAPNMHVLDRMAKTIAVGSGNAVASIHTTHGKRMAPTVSLDDAYQDRGGLCRGRISSVPNESFQFGGSGSKTLDSGHSFPESMLLMSRPNHSELPVKPVRNFAPKQSVVPVHRMLSLPGQSGGFDDGGKDSEELESNAEDLPTDRIQVNGPRNFRSPSLPLQVPGLPPPLPHLPPPSSRPPAHQKASSVVSMKPSPRPFDPPSEESDRNWDSSDPPPLPPLRPESASSGSNRAQGVTSSPLPPPPFPPAPAVPPSNRLFQVDGEAANKEEEEEESRNPFLRNLQRANEAAALPAYSEYATIEGTEEENNERGAPPGLAIPSPAENSFLAELQRKKLQMEEEKRRKRIPTAEVHQPDPEASGEDPPPSDQEPFLNELLKALNGRTAPPAKPSLPPPPPPPQSSVAGRVIPPVAPKKNTAKANLPLPCKDISKTERKKEEEEEEHNPFPMVKLKPVVGSRNALPQPPSAPPPPLRPTKDLDPGRGRDNDRSQVAFTKALDLDLPLPPPPPPPQEFEGHDFLADDFLLPLPPPPPMDF